MLRKSVRVFIAGLFACLCSLASVSATAGIDLDVLSATPIGSWSVREETTTDHRGRQTVTVMRTSMLGKEQRNGQTYYWIEMVADSYKIKRDKRKKDGDRVILKSLVSEELLKGDPANAAQNLRGFGEEVIVQSGDSQPMRMSGAGGFAEGMMQGMGVENKFDFEAMGSEKVTVPAGSFTAQKLQGSSSTEMKIVFKKVSVQTRTVSYFSNEVPFAIVKAESETTTNGKDSTSTTQLIEFGRSGAQSQLSGEPQEMPQMPNMKDLFGG